MESLLLKGVRLITPKLYQDERGFFLESFRDDMGMRFVQDNHSFSVHGVLRGMHFQLGQAKLIRVAVGRIYDVAVDIRANSPTFGQWCGVYLDGDKHEQLLIPAGFAHGFCVVSENAHVLYKVSTFYDPALEKGFRYDDPKVGIDWPIDNPILSQRDLKAPKLETVI